MERFRLLYVALVVAITAGGTCQGGKIQPLRTWHVKVTNRMSHGEVITLNCKSGDDDLGVKQLRPGQLISWQFKINVWTSTHFWCHAWHGKSPRRYHVMFDVFRASDEAFEGLLCEPNSNWCVWEVRDDGVYTHRVNDLVFRRWEKDTDAAAEPPETAFLGVY